jgi:hypothetical protein
VLDEITPQEQAIVTTLKALQGPDSKPLFDDAESYNGTLEGKDAKGLKDELERRGMHTAFVFSTGGPISHIRHRQEPRAFLPEFVVLVAAVNLSGDASTRVGSPESVGVYALATAVKNALDGQSIGGPAPIYAKDWSLLVTTQQLAMAAVIFDYTPPAPYKRP